MLRRLSCRLSSPLNELEELLTVLSRDSQNVIVTKLHSCDGFFVESVPFEVVYVGIKAISTQEAAQAAT